MITSTKKLHRNLFVGTLLLKRLSLLLLATSLSGGMLHAATTGTWSANTLGTYTWGTGANWTLGNIPGSTAGDTAIFTGATGLVTVDLGSNETLGTLSITTSGTTSTGYTIASTGGSLVMNSNGAVGGAAINLSYAAGTSNVLIVSAPIVIADSNGLTITTSSGNGHSSTISGGITSTGTGNLVIKNNTTAAAGLSMTGLINNSGTVTNSGGGVSGTTLTTLGGGIGSNVTGVTQGSVSGLTISGALAVNSSGTTLTSNSTGAFTVNAGTTGTGNLSVNDTAGGAINITTTAVTQTGNLSLTESGAGIVTVSSGVTGTDNITLNNNGTTAGGIVLSTSANNVGTITNQGSGSGSVTLSANLGGFVQGVTQNSANSVLILSGTNSSFGGGLTVTSGTVQLGGTSALNLNNVVNFGAGGTGVLELKSFSNTVAGLSGSAAGSLVANDFATGRAVLTLSPAAGATYTYGGSLADYVSVTGGSLGITMQGSGTQIFTGLGTSSPVGSGNTYSGTTSVNSGTLETTLNDDSGGLTPFGTGTLTLNGGVLNFTPVLTTPAAVSLAGATGSGVINLGGGATIVLNANGNTSLLFTAGNGSGNVIRTAGAGTLVITPTAGIANLGTTEMLEFSVGNTPTPNATNGMIAPYFVGQASATDTSGDFLTYGGSGFATDSGSYTTHSTAAGTFTPTATEISNVTASSTIASGSSLYALRIGSATGGAATVMLAGTVTDVSGGVILNGSSSPTTASAITGGTLAFGSTEADIYTSGTGSISSPITGTGGLTVFGPGTLTLSGTNSSLTGTININGGLTVGTFAQLGTSGTAFDPIAFNGGTLTVTGTAGNLTTQTFAINPGGATINETAGMTVGGGSSNPANGLTGSGNLILTGSGDFRISDSNSSFTGGISVLNGELDFTYSTTPANSGSIAANSTPIILGNSTGSNSVTFNSGGGGFSARPLVVAGGNSGTVTITTGGSGSSPAITSNITLGTDGATANSGVGHSVLLTTGGFQNTYFSGLIQDPTNLNSSTAGVVTFLPVSAPLEIRGANTFSGGAILGSSSASSGTIVVNGTNTPFGTGAVTVASGGAAISDIGTNTIANQLTLTGNLSFNTGDISGDAANTNLILTGNVLMSGGGRSIQVTSTKNLTLGGIISDGNNGYTLTTSSTSTGNVVLSGANTYGGGTVISPGYIVGNTGVVQLSGAGTLGATTGALTINSGFLDLNGTNQTVGAFSGVGGAVINSNATTPSTLTVSNSTPVTFAGSLSTPAGDGVVNLTKNGAGTLALTGASNTTGTFNLNAGVVSVSSNAGPASQTATTLGLGTTMTFANALAAHSNITVTGSTTGLAVGQLITGSGIPAGTTIFAVGTGTIQLSAATTGASSGTYSVFTNAPTTAAFATNATSITVGSNTNIAIGDLVTGTGIQGSTFVTSISGTTIGLSQATTSANGAGSQYAFGGIDQISVSSSTGLTNGETVTGTGIGGPITHILGNVLTLNTNNTAIGTSPTATLAAWDSTGAGTITFGGGTLQYATASPSAADYSSRIAGSSGAIAIDTNGKTVTYASQLAASNIGGLTLNDSLGTGTLILSSSTGNAYVGTTTVTAGTLKTTGSGTLGSTNNNLTVNGGSLDLSGTNQTVANFNGSGGTVQNSNASATSTLFIGNNNATGGNYSGTVSSGLGILGIDKIGSGVQTLSSANTYTGGTAVTLGTLYGNGGAVGASTSTSNFGTGPVTVSANGAAGGNGVYAPSAAGFALAGTGTTTLSASATLISGGVQPAVSASGALTQVNGSAVVGSFITSSATTAPIPAGGVGGLVLDNRTAGGVILNAATLGASVPNANLTFYLGAGTVGADVTSAANAGMITTTNDTTGQTIFNFANPNIDSTFITVLGNTANELSFASGDTITAIDLTGKNLQFNINTPYLLIHATSNMDYSGITTTGGSTGGIANNGYVTDLTLTIGATTAASEYYATQLYLFNGNLEIVPEPGTWALMLGGFALLVVLQRRRFAKR